LAALLPKLEKEGFTPNLVGIVKEELGVNGFRDFFKGGELYLDAERKTFFALGERWINWLAPRLWYNIIRASVGGFKGDMKGEGKLMGGLVVVGPGDQGVLFTFREEVVGDHANPEDVMTAVRLMKKPELKSSL